MYLEIQLIFFSVYLMFCVSVASVLIPLVIMLWARNAWGIHWAHTIYGKLLQTFLQQKPMLRLDQPLWFFYYCNIHLSKKLLGHCSEQDLLLTGHGGYMESLGTSLWGHGKRREHVSEALLLIAWRVKCLGFNEFTLHWQI